MRLLLLILAASLLACDTTGDDTADTLEGRLRIDLLDQQRIGGDGIAPPVPTLLIQTDTIYGCSNFPIDVDVRQQDGAIDVTVLGVTENAFCATALGPAQARVPLTVPAGTHRLRVVHDGATDLYDVTVADDRLRLDAVSASVTYTEDPLAWRFPRHSFVYLCGTTTGDEALCDDFRQRLEAAVPLTPIDVPEAGRWPYPRQPGGYYVNTPATVYQARSDADFETAKEALRQFAIDRLLGRQGIGLSVQAWDGDYGFSWMYANE